MTLEWPRLRRPGVWAASIGAATALAVLVSACGSSGLSYVSSSDRNAYFKVPGNWHFFDKKYILVASGQSLSGESNRQLSWLIGFDADPHPSIQHVIDITDAAKYPVVTARAGPGRALAGRHPELGLSGRPACPGQRRRGPHLQGRRVAWRASRQQDHVRRHPAGHLQSGEWEQRDTGNPDWGGGSGHQKAVSVYDPL